MLKTDDKRRIPSMIHCVIALLFLSISSLVYAELSQQDALLLNNVSTQLQNTPHPNVTIAIQSGHITLSGIVADNVLAGNLIANTIAIPGVMKINFNNLTLPNGVKISPEAITIGFAAGSLLKSTLFGKDVTTMNQMPIRFSGENGIVYIDGIVNNLYTLATTVKTTQLAAQQFNGRVRVISRLVIRKVTVKMP